MKNVIKALGLAGLIAIVAGSVWYAMDSRYRKLEVERDQLHGQNETHARDMAKLATTPSEEFTVAEVLDLISKMSASFAETMEGNDVFICPTMTVPAVFADRSMWDADFKIAGVTVDPEFGYSTTHQFNLLSNCPALSIPAGRASFGVPTHW